jgi:CheY-like chemotaxis protein
MKPAGVSVLLVEDEVLIAMALAAQIEDLGYQVCGVASDMGEAIAQARAHRPSVIVMDVRLRNGDDGVDAAQRITAQLDTKVVFLTGSCEQSTIDRIASANPFAVLFKPISDGQLADVLMRAASGAGYSPP